MDTEGIILIAGIVVQSIVYRTNRLAGSIVSFVVTAFALVSGILVYGKSETVSLIGVQIPEFVFIIVCIAWFGVDVFMLVDAIKARKKPAGSSRSI